MSAPEGAAPRTARRRRTGRVGAAIVGVGALLLAVVVAGAPAEDTALDPTSAGPNGLRGVVDLLTRLDVEVDVSLDPPDDTATRVFVPLDVLGTQRRDALRDWVRSGGVLVVAGADARLHGLVPGQTWLAQPIGSVARAPDCDTAALTEVGEVAHARWESIVVPDDPGVTACFAADELAWLVAVPEGEGTIIALGSAAPFVNAALDDADNAVLAAALLGPRPGDRLVVVPRPPVGEGDAELLDLVPERVWAGLVLLLAALALAVVWQGRRHGAPVPEALPPVLPAAELPRSLARLLERTGSRQGAADRLREGAGLAVIAALHVAGDTPRPMLVDLAVGRLDVEAGTARRALLDTPVDRDEDLVAVARAAREVHRAGRRWTRPTTTYRQSDVAE